MKIPYLKIWPDPLTIVALQIVHFLVVNIPNF